MQIFAFTECPNFQALLEVECKEVSGVRPIIRTTLNELKSLLDIFQTIDILIIDSPKVLSDVEEIKKFLTTNRDKIKKPMLINLKDIGTSNVQVFDRSDLSPLFRELKTYFDPDSLPQTEWTAVPICTLVHFKTLPFDLYIKLSDDKYVKRVPAHEEMGKEFIENLTYRGVIDLYCNKQYNREFSVMLIKNMINKIDRDYDSISEKLTATNEVLETTREIIQNLGLPKRILQVCETTVDRMCLDVMASKDEFSMYYESLKNNSDLSFQYKLISLTNYLGTQLIQDMKLPNFEEEVKKFIYASFFCDMTLKKPDFLYRRSADQIKELNLEDQNEVNFHALKSSDLVTSNEKIPKMVGQIIRQHHGSFSGIGFPVEKSSDLLPLAKILVISQGLAFEILNENEASAAVTVSRFIKMNTGKGLQEILEILGRTYYEKAQKAE